MCVHVKYVYAANRAAKSKYAASALLLKRAPRAVCVQILAQSRSLHILSVGMQSGEFAVAKIPRASNFIRRHTGAAFLKICVQKCTEKCATTFEMSTKTRSDFSQRQNQEEFLFPAKI